LPGRVSHSFQIDANVTSEVAASVSPWAAGYVKRRAVGVWYEIALQVTDVTDLRSATRDNWWKMSLRQPMRRAMSLILAMVLVLWAQFGMALTIASGHGSGCAAHGPHSPMQHAGTHAMASGCCPGHSVAKPKCPSHPAASLPAMNRPDCCNIGRQPFSPETVLLGSGRPTVTELVVVRAANAHAPDFAICDAEWDDTSPPVIRPVLDQKADLRI
jgi:hypothetical protein